MREALEKLGNAIGVADTQEGVNACRLAATERVLLHVLQGTNGALGQAYGGLIMNAAKRNQELRGGSDKRWPRKKK